MSAGKNFFKRFLATFFCNACTAFSVQSGIKHFADFFSLLSEIVIPEGFWFDVTVSGGIEVEDVDDIEVEPFM